MHKNEMHLRVFDKKYICRFILQINNTTLHWIEFSCRCYCGTEDSYWSTQLLFIVLKWRKTRYWYTVHCTVTLSHLLSLLWTFPTDFWYFFIKFQALHHLPTQQNIFYIKNKTYQPNTTSSNIFENISFLENSWFTVRTKWLWPKFSKILPKSYHFFGGNLT